MRDLQCRFCQRGFSKGEHLRRHERSHTGYRPFTCKDCKRTFGRQDSLQRHERLHLRKESASYVSPPAESVPPSEPSATATSFPNSFNYEPNAVNEAVQHDDATEQLQTTDPTIEHITPSPELDFDLIWPDTQDLFQTLISSDAPWQMPLTTLPFPTSGYQPDYRIYGTPSSFDDRASSVASIPSGSGHKAVHDVSQMVTSLSSSVTAAVEATSITSVFLDECLHMFFLRFIPTFPVLHKATFVFRECTHPLLLNAIAIGSLYLGPKESVAKGEVLWRLAHTAVATSWETLITHKGPYDAGPGVQLVLTALFGQLYGVLSKNRAIRTTSQAFHTMGFFWARHCGMQEIEPFSCHDLPALDASEVEKDRQWRIWASREIQRRALLAQYVLDGLIARMSGEPTSIRHAANQLGLSSDEAAFEASTSSEWLSCMHSRSVEESTFRSIYRQLFAPADAFPYMTVNFSAFSMKVILEGLQSLVTDCDNDEEPAVGVPTKPDICNALARTYDGLCTNVCLSNEDRLEARLRWHAICLDASINSALLCKWICFHYGIQQHLWKDGGGKPNHGPELDLIQWTSTPDSRKALLHSVAMQEIVEQLPRGRAHVIYMPSALFAAATVYSAFSLAGLTTATLPGTVDWKEALAQPDADLSSPLSASARSAVSSATASYIQGMPASTFGTAKATRNLLYELNSMQKLFRCLSAQWGIAYDMEDIVSQWITVCH